jgi:hypothetical protein
MAERMRALKFGTDLWDPSHRFETSWILTPWVLFGCRAAIVGLRFLPIQTLLMDLVSLRIRNNILHHRLGSDEPRRSLNPRCAPIILLLHKYVLFLPYPHTILVLIASCLVLCYWGISFYFLISALHTFSYAINGGTPLLNRLPRPLQALHYLFYTTITTFPFLVTIVYWAILYSGFSSRFTLWSNVSQHALNSVFGLFELAFSRINPSPWIHLLWLIVILACYCGLAYVTYATKHYYVYSFLNPNPPDHVVTNGVKTNQGGVGKGAVVGYVFGIAAAIIVIFCVSKGLQTLRKWGVEKKLGMKGKFYAGRGMGSGEVELETARVWEKGPGEA